MDISFVSAKRLFAALGNLQMSPGLRERGQVQWQPAEEEGEMLYRLQTEIVSRSFYPHK